MVGVRAWCSHPVITGRIQSWWAVEVGMGGRSVHRYLPGSGAGTGVCPVQLASFGTLSP